MGICRDLWDAGASQQLRVPFGVPIIRTRV